MTSNRRSAPTGATPIEVISERMISWRRRALLAVTGFSVAGLGLLALTPVQQIAFVPGELRPADNIIVLRTTAGGRVAEITARADEIVAPGASILRFDDRDLNAEEARFMARRAHMALKRDRLAAQLDGQDYDPSGTPGVAAADIANARRQFLAERADQDSAEAEIAARIAEHGAEMRATEATLRAIKAEVAAYGSQTDIAENLSQKNIGTWRALLDSEAQLAQGEARLAEVTGRLDSAQSALMQLESERARGKAKRLAAWSAELSETAAKIADFDAALDDLAEQRALLDIRAPIAGRLLELGAATSGDVIVPGALVARIVPVSNDAQQTPIPLVADIRVSPRDVGYVRVGADAVVQASAFDTDVFGEIHGYVASMSPSTIMGEDGQPFYRGELHLDRVVSDNGGAQLSLTSGMIVTAKIATAETTLLGYLTDPVRKSLDVAFSER